MKMPIKRKFNALFFLLLALPFVFEAQAQDYNDYDFSWLDNDKKVYVLQNRKFRKDNRFYVGATGGMLISGAFLDSYEGSLHLGYFFNENWGIEANYTLAMPSKNDTYKGVNEQGAVAFFRQIESSQSAYLMWSPFYAKINSFNKIFYFDWLFGAGLASVETKDNRVQFDSVNDTSLIPETNIGFTWTTGMRFFITNNWSTRIDFRALHLPTKAYTGVGGSGGESKSRLFNYYNFHVGINYSF